MLVFIDTEFTDFLNCDLISIGMVSTAGDEFYFERNDFIKSWCNPFVVENIFPLLSKQGPNVGTKEDCARAVVNYFNSLNCETFEIVYDYVTDLEFLYWVLDYELTNKCNRTTHLDMIVNTTESKRACMLAIEKYFAENGNRHHSLQDAKANLAGWLAGTKQLNSL